MLCTLHISLLSEKKKETHLALSFPRDFLSKSVGIYSYILVSQITGVARTELFLWGGGYDAGYH